MVPQHWRLLTDHLPVPAALLRSSLLMRHTRRVSDPFDVIISGHNECDFGRRGIQYINFSHFIAKTNGSIGFQFSRANSSFFCSY
jgi:hypothetical protein